jgi:3-phenylpropionate/trans-cinnamate dioxygenase ferredoxin subunit
MSEPCITIVENGPLKVQGGIPLEDADGNPVETREGKAYYLCRCGASTNKPFCDGTHSRIGFLGANALREAMDEDS